MKRRDFITGGLSLAALAALPRPAGARAGFRGWLVPGYRPDQAFVGAGAALKSAALRANLPGAYEGPTTLLTRIRASDGDVRRTLMPIGWGHEIAVRPDGRIAFWAGMNGLDFLGFDPDRLKLTILAKPHAENFCAGGHAVFLPDNKTLLVTERMIATPWAGAPERHFGVVTIRDADSFRILDRFSSAGIAPHEINLMADGKHVAIANYGTINPTESYARADLRGGALTVIELASGKPVLVQPATRAEFEVRHVAGHALNRVAAIQAHQAPLDEYAGRQALPSEMWEADQTVDQAQFAYQPAPIFSWDGAARHEADAAALECRQGQSIIYDPRHDEYIASFATSHRIQILDGATGQLKTLIKTDALGLRQPRGVALLPGGDAYAVTGSWNGLVLFERGSHRPLLDRSRLDLVFFDHSHLTAY